MAIWIGTDEAGYGPNLGPLLIAATVWEVPEALGTSSQQFDRILAPFVTRQPTRPDDIERLAIADSKALYKPGGSLAGLERGVFAAASVLGNRPVSCRDAWPTWTGKSLEGLRDPTYSEFEYPLPIAVNADVCDRLAMRLNETLASAGVRLRRMRAAAVFPERFNEQLARFDGKGTVLSHTTLTLVRSLLPPEPQRVLIHCDKHGGRNRYQPLLRTLFPEHFVEVVREGRAVSEYRWGPAEQRVEIRFVAKGESFLPSALASMLAKYLRELAMLAFNNFWRLRIPGLKPTAGYPADAKRFWHDIAEERRSLGLDDGLLWRRK